MNYCPSENYWLYINATDILDQLSWLAKTLQNSENIGEKVHILGHIHPSSCMDSWSENYYRIVNRYESTITGQFFGHSHSDEFELFYDLKDNKRATGIAYIPGSVTTYSNLNPGYRIYEVDGLHSNATWQVLDYKNVFMNLTEANINLRPVYRTEYTAKEAYGLKSLFPQDWSNLIDRMLNDINGPLVDKLYNFYSKSADVQSPCDSNCRRSFVCGYKQARSRPLIPC
jgi:sphingomyelin phosphodiesterase